VAGDDDRGRQERDQRLRAALRENLRRRKAQARGRQAGAADAADRRGEGERAPAGSDREKKKPNGS
jgi:hypothetical protein